MRLDEKISSSVTSFGRPKIDSAKLPRIRICVLGSPKVGKTDLLYKKTVKIDAIPSPLEIADTSSSGDEFSFPSVHVSWADCCVVVYSIQSASSFEAAASMLEAIQRLKVPFYLPVLLLANKKDLEHYRQVRAEDGQALAVQSNCHFAEISAAEDVDGVLLTLTALFREVRTLKAQRISVRQRRPTLLNVTKLFSSLKFGRNNSNSDLRASWNEETDGKVSEAIKQVVPDTPIEKESGKMGKGIKKRPSFTI